MSHSAEISTPVTYRALLAVALPVMLSNLSIPLIGIVDTAAVGRLPEAYHIGAVAIGALIFDFVFWAFGFLRMSTSGFAAQAEGARDDQELRNILTRALTLALAFGVLLVVLQPVIASLAFNLIDASPDVERAARAYFDIRIWSAPATLANYVFYGFFIGIGRARVVFAFVVLVNSVNIILDLLFVLGFGMAADGVALGTLLAEVSGALGAIWLVVREFRVRTGQFDLSVLRRMDRIRRMMAVNADILIRTVCLVFAFSWFTAQSAAAGDVVLAANTVLFNMYTLTAYFLDGAATAVEAFVGQAIGARRRADYHRVVKLSFHVTLAIALVVTVLFFLLGRFGIDALTTNPEVRQIARAYLLWVAIAPLIGFWCFLFDGIFIGATQTRDMRNMMIITIAVYLISWWALVAAFDNHGRWAAIMVLFVVRAATLASRMPALERDAFGAPAHERYQSP